MDTEPALPTREEMIRVIADAMGVDFSRLLESAKDKDDAFIIRQYKESINVPSTRYSSFSGSALQKAAMNAVRDAAEENKTDTEFEG
jgi:hypothetical protein